MDTKLYAWEATFSTPSKDPKRPWRDNHHRMVLARTMESALRAVLGAFPDAELHSMQRRTSDLLLAEPQA
jgi:hypothetical protein